MAKGRRQRQDFTTSLEEVARGVRRLEEIRDPVLRDAIAAALRLREGATGLDPAARARMRRRVLEAIAPSRPTLADHVMSVFSVLAKPTPVLLRILALVLAGAGLLAGATVASADSLPDDVLYPFKLAGEQLRLAIASTPEDRAAVGISIAAHRLEEAERLAEAGRDDATIEATAAYGVSLATAAAELASVESLQPKLAELVTQLQAQLRVQQDRVGATAVRLAGDPRTAGAAAVLGAVGPPSGAEVAPSAVLIADSAAAVTTRLAAVAETRVAQAGAVSPGVSAGPATEPPAATSEPDRAADRPAADRPAVGAEKSNKDQPAIPAATERSSLAAPTRGAAAAPVETARPVERQTARPTTQPTVAVPVDLNAAREAAQHAQRAAEEAKRAAERAREGSKRTHSPAPRR